MGLLDSLLGAVGKGLKQGLQPAVNNAANKLQQKTEKAVQGSLDSATNKVAASHEAKAAEKAAEKAAAEAAKAQATAQTAAAQTQTAAGTASEPLQNAQNAPGTAPAQDQAAVTSSVQESQPKPSMTAEQLAVNIAVDPGHNRRKARVEDLTGYMGDLANEWNNQQETGYVWTITMNDVTKYNALGLASVTYTMNLSCSHVGPTINGVYRGSMGFSAAPNYGGLKVVLAAMGGAMSADEYGWFKNDNFLMRLAPYQKEDEDMFEQTLAKPQEDPQAAQLEASVQNALQASNAQKPVPLAAPVGYWCDWEYRMTEGDMTNYAKVFVFGGLARADAKQDNSGHSVTGDAVASFPFIGTFREHINDIVDGPFPYHLKVYPGGQAVLDLFGPNSSTVFVRFTGTWDRVPVEDTFLVQ